MAEDRTECKVKPYGGDFKPGSGDGIGIEVDYGFIGEDNSFIEGWGGN